MQTVTPRQMEILLFVRDYCARHGYSPTMQEIGNHLHVSRVTVFEHIGALEKKGLLRRGLKHSARSLQLSDDVVFPDGPRPGRFRLAGRIAAGEPIEAVEQNESIDLEEMFADSGDTFCLQVVGQSMIDEQIRDGDYVICRRCREAADGQTVVALLDNGEATLKKFYREADRIRLQPANPEFSPIYADNISIQGTVIGVIRKF
ncbi:MAG: transcriptional repressor LexA [Planctomycetota bacterium]|nr:transcriptional repressor LexA [Planctomycetota bacterium]